MGGEMIGGVIVGALVSKALFGAWRTLQAQFDVATKRCGTYDTGVARDACVAKQRLALYQKKLQILRSTQAECSKQKNPEKCKEKLKNAIEETSQKVNIERDNVILYNKAAVRAAAAKLS
jgi:hypothetical protein